SRRRHTRSYGDWSSDVCSSDLTDAGGTVHLRPIGEIDGDNAHEIREVVSALLATSTPRMITVDMADVAFIDSMGIGALVHCHHEIGRASCRERGEVAQLGAIHR